MAVEKVKAHVTAKDLAAGYSVFFREGNAYADAGAKLGRTHHPRNEDLEASISKAYVLVQMIARFIARVSVECMDANDDTPPYVPRIKDVILATVREKEQSKKHCIITEDSRVRCLWCLKSSGSADKQRPVSARWRSHSLEVRRHDHLL